MQLHILLTHIEIIYAFAYNIHTHYLLINHNKHKLKHLNTMIYEIF